MLEVTDLKAHYGFSYILQGISLNVSRGSIITVLGRNGVGKTTLVHTIVSFVKPSGGLIRLDGKEITTLSTHQIMRRGVALVPQGRRVFRSLSVTENLAIPFRCSFKTKNSIQPWAVDQIFDVFPALRARKDQRAGNLSGGEQQMLALGRALVSGPKLLLLDEPSEGLAPMIVEQIAGVISGLAAEGLAVLLVEQNFNMAIRLADRIYVMSRGMIVHESSPAELAGNEEIKARYLGM